MYYEFYDRYDSSYDIDYDCNEREKLRSTFSNISYELEKNSDETLLNKKLDENNELARMTFPGQRTLLHLVALFGSLNAAERLIQLGANINTPDSKGRTALYCAIEYRPDMVTFLLSKGADVDITPKDGSPLLRHALMWGSTQTMDQLLNKMFNNYSSGENAETSTDVEKCENKGVICLLKHERHLIPNKFEFQVDLKQRLIDKLNTRFLNPEIHKTYEKDIKKCRKIVEFLLKQKIDFSSIPEKFKFRVDKKQRPLEKFNTRFLNPEIHKTYEKDVKKCRKIVEFLLKQKIDFSLSNDKYSYLLRFVLKYGDEDTFNLVLQEDKNIDLNASGLYGIPILHLVIHDDKDEAYLKRLVDQGVDVNVVGFDNFTALHYAARANNAALVRYILSHGADDPNKKAQGEITPLHSAVLNGNKEIIEMLLNAGADVKVCILSVKNFITRENLERISYTSTCDMYSLSPLEIACRIGRSDLVELIWNYGSAVQYNHNFEKKTFYDMMNMLKHAIVGRNIDVFHFLIQKGVDFNVKDLVSISLLHFILLWAKFKDGVLEKYLSGPMTEFLLDYEANITHSSKVFDFDESFDHSLYMAAGEDLPDVVECLLQIKADFKTGKIYEKHYSPILKKSCGRSRKLLAAFKAITEVDIPSEDGPIFFNEYSIEVARLKNRRICDDRLITLFDFLTRDLYELTQFFFIDKLLKALEVSNYKDEFPSYAFLLEKRIERVKYILLFKDSIMEFMEGWAEVQIPLLVRDHIFSFCRIRDIRNFARALSLLKQPFLNL